MLAIVNATAAASVPITAMASPGARHRLLKAKRMSPLTQRQTAQFDELL